jgi:nucleotide-binding universal stress UspA family protein
MCPVVVDSPRTASRDGQARRDRGVVMCLCEPSPHWRGTLRLATLLATATGTALVVDPGGTERGPRGRITHVREMTQRAGAGILVTTARTRMAGLLAPDHSPALARATRIATVLVPRRAAEGLVVRGPGRTALVCGVDGSPAAEAGVKFAGTLAAKLELRLHLVHAYDPAPLPAVALGPGGVIPVRPQELERSSREAAWKVLERAGRLAGGDALLRLRLGRPARCLNRYAELFDAALIVIGAPRHGPVASALLGSAAWELATSAVTPIMLVPKEGSVLDAHIEGEEVRFALWDQMEPEA